MFKCVFFNTIQVLAYENECLKDLNGKLNKRNLEMTKEISSLKDEKNNLNIQIQTSDFRVREKEKNYQDLNEKLKEKMALDEDRLLEVHRLRRELKALQETVNVEMTFKEKFKQFQIELSQTHTVIDQFMNNEQKLIKEIENLKKDALRKNDLHGRENEELEILSSMIQEKLKSKREDDTKNEQLNTHSKLEERSEKDDEIKVDGTAEKHLFLEDVFVKKLEELKKQNKALIEKFDDYYLIMDTFKKIIFGNP